MTDIYTEDNKNVRVLEIKEKCLKYGKKKLFIQLDIADTYKKLEKKIWCLFKLKKKLK